ncbi:M48 family metalloprotease [Kitasatospora sp. McL0602]|uniref:M48 family metalloprotease n=1 Tax=Kitasatospora sp. McL0602 TaxID=3439530 RepID=UPI003F8C8304
MPPHSLVDARPCPECGSDLPSDERFTDWCPACEWNLAPAAAPDLHRTPRRQRRAERAKRKETARKATVRARVEKLYAAMADDSTPHRDGARYAAAALAGLVHLLTVSLLTLSLVTIWGGTWPLRVLGLIGLAVTATLRPRLGRIPDDGSCLSRTDAPALHALADRVAAAVGARPVDVILTDGRFNASYGRAGFGRRSKLTLGLPLWQILTPQQRVALLAHEFGHDVNHDARRGLWLWSALEALVSWHDVLRPVRGRSPGEALAALVQVPLRRVVLTVLLLLERLTIRSGQSAEYRADALAASVASTDAAQRMLEAMLLDRSIATALVRHRSTPAQRRRTAPDQQQPADLWQAISDQATSVPALERERLFRLSAREMGSTDRSHPPTHLRIRMLGHRPAQEPTVVLTAAESATIEAELAPARARVARDLLG